MYLSSSTWFQNKETFPWREPVPYVGVSLTSVVLEDCSAQCVVLALSHVGRRETNRGVSGYHDQLRLENACNH